MTTACELACCNVPRRRPVFCSVALSVCEEESTEAACQMLYHCGCRRLRIVSDIRALTVCIFPITVPKRNFSTSSHFPLPNQLDLVWSKQITGHERRRTMLVRCVSGRVRTKVLVVVPCACARCCRPHISTGQLSAYTVLF